MQLLSEYCLSRSKFHNPPCRVTKPGAEDAVTVLRFPVPSAGRQAGRDSQPVCCASILSTFCREADGKRFAASRTSRRMAKTQLTSC